MCFPHPEACVYASVQYAMNYICIVAAWCAAECRCLLLCFIMLIIVPVPSGCRHRRPKNLNTEKPQYHRKT